MKAYILTFLLITTTMIGYAQKSESRLQHPNRTALLDSLYEVTRQLQIHGTPEQLMQNRLNIRDAWAQVDPELASRYKPIDNGGKLPEIPENLEVNGIWVPNEIMERPEVGPTEVPEWGNDLLIRDDWVDGLDMKQTSNGNIYIAMYENIINGGGQFDSIFIYRSMDGGENFSLYRTGSVTVPITKMTMEIIDGGSPNYINIFYLTESNTLQIWSSSISAPFFVSETQVIKTNVFDFDSSLDDEGLSANRRCYALYQLNSDQLFSARSTIGRYGLDWVDESFIGGNAKLEIHVTQGAAGGYYGCWTDFSNRIWSSANENYCDPASWENNEVVDIGDEYRNLAIVASYGPPGFEDVYIFSNTRNSGSNDPYNIVYYERQAGAQYQLVQEFTPTSGFTYGKISTGRNEQSNSNHTFNVTFLQSPTTAFNVKAQVYNIPWNADPFNSIVAVSDVGNDAYFAVEPALTELPPTGGGEGNVLVAFAGEVGLGSGGRGLYVDGAYLNTGINANMLESQGYLLEQNRPNPVYTSTNTQIDFRLTNTKHVRLVVTDLLGKEVAILVDENKTVGDHQINWEANVAPGIYLYQLQIDGEELVKKMVVQ